MCHIPSDCDVMTVRHMEIIIGATILSNNTKLLHIQNPYDKIER